MIGYLIRALIRLDNWLHGEPMDYYEIHPPHTGVITPASTKPRQSSGTPDADVIVNFRYRINER